MIKLSQASHKSKVPRAVEEQNDDGAAASSKGRITVSGLVVNEDEGREPLQ